MYKIPNDTGHPWRVNKFIDYHSLGDADMNFPILKEYCNEHKLSVNNRFWLAFLYSTCYCVPTTCFLFEHLDIKTVTQESVEEFWSEYKPKMIFQSDKRYVKNMNWFVTLVVNFIELTHRRPSSFFKQLERGNQQENYDVLYAIMLKWKYFGRFTTFLLIEAIHKLTPLKADSTWFDWKNGNTATSGMMHVLYLDKEAVEFDAKGTLDIEVKELLQKRFITVKNLIEKRYPNASNNITDIETALCGFRKLFKASRYGGYYIDRVQEEIITMEKWMPQEKPLWDEMYRFRRRAFPAEFLGELQGYKGIQKKRNTDFIEKGLTGVESISKH